MPHEVKNKCSQLESSVPVLIVHLALDMTSNKQYQNIFTSKSQYQMSDDSLNTGAFIKVNPIKCDSDCSQQQTAFCY